MSNSDHPYKVFVIETVSYKLASGEWSPKAIVREDRKYEISESPFIWEREFSTKEEADKFALVQAKMWIDRNK